MMQSFKSRTAFAVRGFALTVIALDLTNLTPWILDEVLLYIAVELAFFLGGHRKT